MRNRWFLAVGAMMLGPLLAVAMGVPSDGVDPAPPAPRAIPGLTAPDPYPRGCVDCHVVLAQEKMDVRLSTVIGRWQTQVEPEVLARLQALSLSARPLTGKHPKVKVSGVEIPTSCMKCHTESSKLAPPFGPLIHGLHLLGGEKNHFLTMFGGECTSCHKLDPQTATWQLGTGIEGP